MRNRSARFLGMLCFCLFLASGCGSGVSNQNQGTDSNSGPSGSVGSSGSFQVDLSWDAPSGSTDPVAGYDVYRTLSGGSNWQVLNSAAVTATTYQDKTVANGTTYQYYVAAVDAQGNQSAPSNIFTASIPASTADFHPSASHGGAAQVILVTK